MKNQTIPFYTFPINVQNTICEFDNELQAKIALSKLRSVQKRMRELKRKEDELQNKIDKICPHKRIRKESNGDCHNHGWDKYCVLCNKYIY